MPTSPTIGRFGILALVLGLLSACSGPPDQLQNGSTSSMCTDYAAASVNVAVLASSTETGIQVVIQNLGNGTQETIAVKASDYDTVRQAYVVGGMYEQSGDFLVTVTRPGATTVTRTVSVEADDCHPIPQVVTLRI